MEYGYVRVSTAEQNVARQVERMRSLGIPEDRLFVDKASGKDLDRPEWARLMSVVARGDHVVVDSFDRLGRNYELMIDEWRRLTRCEGVDIRCLDLEVMDSRRFREMGEVGLLMEDQILSLLAWAAQHERDENRRRQAAGIEVARRQGKYAGRRPKEVDAALMSSVAERVRSGEITRAAAASELGVSRDTLRRWERSGRLAV